MNKLILTLVLGAASCLAADPPEPSMSLRVIELKYLRGARVDTLTRSLYNVLNPGRMVYDPSLNVVIIKAPLQQLSAMESLLKKADQPENARRADGQVQLRFHIVAASTEAGKGGAVSDEAAPALEQMRKSFPYQSYRELDVLLLQVRPGNGQVALVGGIGNDLTYQLGINEVNEDAAAETVSLNEFNLAFSSGNARLRTNLTLKKGQKVVIGKLSGGLKSDAIFVVAVADIF